MTDFTKQFNTELTPEETANFNSWANQQPRNIDDEKYDYDMLQQQFTFVKNTSNRLTYRKFYNTMNI